MAIVAADLKFYAAANMPDDDVSTVGGAIDQLRQVVFTQIAANDDLEVFSSSGSDTTQTVTVEGRDATGAYVTATGALAGVSVIILSPATTFERVTKIEMDAVAVGTVTIRRSVAGATVYVIPINERGVFSLFIKSASDPSVIKTRFSKVFAFNDHATLTLTTATIDLTADPDSKIRFAVAVAKDDSTSEANRLAVPSGVTFFDDDNPQNVPGTTLEAQSGIGVWVEQALAAGDTPYRSTLTLEVAGDSV